MSILDFRHMLYGDSRNRKSLRFSKEIHAV